MTTRPATIANPRGLLPVSLFLGALVLAFLLAAQPAAGFGFITKWGSYGGRTGQFTRPGGVATGRAGNVYVVDPRDRVEKFTSRGEFIAQWGTSGRSRGELDRPTAIATDRAGRVYVADGGNDRIEVFDSNGRFLTEWGRHGSGPGRFDRPTGIATDRAGNVYVVDEGNRRVEKFSAGGRFIAQWGGRGIGPGQFELPVDVATDERGDVYVTDTGSGTNGVSKFTSDGKFLLHWGSASSAGMPTAGLSFFGAWGIATDGAGHVYVDDLNRPVSRVYVFSYDGVLLDSFGGLGRADGQFENPAGLATDGRGDLYVADSGNHRIQKFGAPSATFELAAKATLDPRHGAARLVASLPGVGMLTAGGPGIESVSRTAKRAGDFALSLVPTGATRQRLERAGHARVNVRVTYTPTTPGAALTGTRSRAVGLVELPNLRTAELEGARLRVRVSCPKAFGPLCRGRAVAVSARDRCERQEGNRTCRQGAKLTTIASIRLRPGATEVIGLRVRPQFRHRIETWARRPNHRSLLIRQAIHASGLEHGRPRVIYRTYGVQASPRSR